MQVLNRPNQNLAKSPFIAAMPKEKSKKVGVKLRHDPLSTEIEKPVGKLKAPRNGHNDSINEEDNVMSDDDQEDLKKFNKKVVFEDMKRNSNSKSVVSNHKADDDDMDSMDGEEEEDEDGENMIEFDGEYAAATGLTEAEEAVVSTFLNAGRAETRTLADIIMEKIREKEEGHIEEETSQADNSIPPKVTEVYTAVGKLLAHYKSGKLPKALKMLPHLKNWEAVLWLTRPDEWSPCATYACTRIFASNLNAKMTQRFLNLVLLEKVRDDIRRNDKLNYHLYMALKKAVYKPAAFYKGLLLPLAQSSTCTLREATIISSILAKVSIPNDHSAAALLRLAEMPYSGSTSMFLKVLLNKKYALPRRVIDALVTHFVSFQSESRVLPVIWHQSLLVFAQRYKNELDETQREKLKLLLRVQLHHQITPEIRREIFGV